MDVDPSTGAIYVVDWWNQRIEKFAADGTYLLKWGFRGTKTEQGSINFAWDIAVQSSTGRVFVANRESNEIEVFDANGLYVNRWGFGGSANGRFKFPQGVAFDPTNGTLLVSDSGNHRIQRFSITATGHGTWLATYGALGSGPGLLKTPTGIDVAADGTIWVADAGNNQIQRRAPDGTWTAYSAPTGGTAFKGPWGVTVAPDGSIWVADSGHDAIVRMTANGELLSTFTGSDVGAGPLDAPFDVLFGLGGEMYVSDVWNNRVIELM
jgi:DNA-binding beta-propeller fold protein YncE